MSFISEFISELSVRDSKIKQATVNGYPTVPVC